MTSLIFYILLLVVWLLALYRSVSYSEIDIDLRAGISIHWMQILFGVSVLLILSGALLTLVANDALFLSLTAIGIGLEWCVALWIYVSEMSWDEKWMSWSRNRRKGPVSDIVALEHFERPWAARLLCVGLGAIGIVVGITSGDWTPFAALGGVSVAAYFLFAHCRHLRYAAVTRSELLIRYGLPPFRVHRVGLKAIDNALCRAEKNKLWMTIEPADERAFTLKLPSESRVARIVLSHLPMKARADREA